MFEFTEKDGDLIFNVRAVPRASRSEIVAELGGALKVKIVSPPVDGTANLELIKVLAKFFGVPKGAIQILGGQTSKTKQIRVADLNGEKLSRILQGKI